MARKRKMWGYGVGWYVHSTHKLKSVAKKEANRVRKNSNSYVRVKKGAKTNAWHRGKCVVYKKSK